MHPKYDFPEEYQSDQYTNDLLKQCDFYGTFIFPEFILLLKTRMSIFEKTYYMFASFVKFSRQRDKFHSSQIEQNRFPSASDAQCKYVMYKIFADPY